MIFGGVDKERIQLNENTLWAGGPYDPSNPEALEALPEVRRLIFDGKLLDAHKLISQKMMAKPLREMPYETVGDLLLTFPGIESVKDYRRDLNLDTSTPTGDMVIKILSIVAEWERRRIGERTAAAVRMARQNGKAANGFAGYGFKYVGAKGHKRRVADPDERATMKRIVKSRCDGCSWEAIYFEFLKLGIKTKEGKEWSISRLYRAFQAELRLMAKEAGSQGGNSDASPAPPTTDG